MTDFLTRGSAWGHATVTTLAPTTDQAVDTPRFVPGLVCIILPEPAPDTLPVLDISRIAPGPHSRYIRDHRPRIYVHESPERPSEQIADEWALTFSTPGTIIGIYGAHDRWHKYTVGGNHRLLVGPRNAKTLTE